MHFRQCRLLLRTHGLQLAIVVEGDREVGLDRRDVKAGAERHNEEERNQLGQLPRSCIPVSAPLQVEKLVDVPECLTTTLKVSRRYGQ